jgi:hypothetical protein
MMIPQRPMSFPLFSSIVLVALLVLATTEVQYQGQATSTRTTALFVSSFPLSVSVSVSTISKRTTDLIRSRISSSDGMRRWSMTDADESSSSSIATAMVLPRTVNRTYNAMFCLATTLFVGAPLHVKSELNHHRNNCTPMALEK